MGIVYILIRAGIKFTNKKNFRYFIPAHTSSFRALGISERTGKKTQLTNQETN
jgi:hypothetical protein